MASEEHHHHDAGEHETQHVFNRGDLLQHYQMLESIAAMMPHELLEEELSVQIDALVGQFEHQLYHLHADRAGPEEAQPEAHAHNDHEHCHDEEHHGHDHHHHHHHHHHHLHIDVYAEELKDEQALVEYRQQIQSAYKPLHPHLYDFKNWAINPALKALVTRHPAHGTLVEPIEPVSFDETHPALRLMETPNPADVANVPEDVKDGLLKLLKEEAPGIFVFDFLEPAFCAALLEEIAHFEEWCKLNNKPVNRPNSMNNYGAILDDFGFQPTLEQLVSQYMNVLSAVVYSYIGPTLDHHHGFMVAYEMDKDINLSMHVDDSDVTLNVCLGRDFTKGELLFAGARCNHHNSTTQPLPGERVLIEHKLGQAVLHVGRHRHSATAITSGQRYNLILWCRSSKFRRLDSMLDCPDWCPIASLIEQQSQAESGSVAP